MKEIVNPKAPFTTRRKRKRKVGFLWLSDSEEGFLSKEEGKYYAPHALIDLLNDIGYEASLITASGVSGSTMLENAEAGSYDAMIFGTYVPSFYEDHDGHAVLTKRQESKLRFLSSLNCKLLMIHGDSSYSFTNPKDLPFAHPRYFSKDFHLNDIRVFVPGEDLTYFMDRVFSDDNLRYSVSTSQTHTVAIDFNWDSMTECGHKSPFDAEYDVMYVGNSRDGDRSESQVRLLAEAAKNLKVQWVGISKERAEEILGVDCSSMSFKDKSDNTDFLNSTYNKSLTSVIVGETFVNNQTTFRIWEILMSNSVLLFDRDIPPSALMKSMLPSKEREVYDSSDLEDIVLRLKNEDGLYKRMIREQREVIYSKGVDCLQSFRRDLINEI